MVTLHPAHEPAHESAKGKHKHERAASYAAADLRLLIPSFSRQHRITGLQP